MYVTTARFLSSFYAFALPWRSYDVKNDSVRDIPDAGPVERTFPTQVFAEIPAPLFTFNDA